MSSPLSGFERSLSRKLETALLVDIGFLFLTATVATFTPEFDKFCTEHRILTECMPAHSSHYL